MKTQDIDGNAVCEDCEVVECGGDFDAAPEEGSCRRVLREMAEYEAHCRERLSEERGERFMEWLDREYAV